MSLPMDRQQAFQLLQSTTKTPSLIKHALCVEGAMRHFAQKFGEDPEYWGMVGLLHDIDFDLYPEEHCQHAPQMLRQAGFDEEFIRAVLSHAWGLRTGVQPEKQMEKVIYTVDELTGLITATALMRPSKSVMDLEAKSVKKKFKTPAFAASINREVIQGGCDLLGLPLDEVIAETILALRAIADEIGFGMATSPAAQ